MKIESARERDRASAMDLLEIVRARVSDDSKPMIRGIVLVMTDENMAHHIHHSSSLNLSETLGQLDIAHDSILDKAKGHA